jgi:hypothetical protein
MITQYEVPTYLTQILPAFASKPQICSLSMNVYKEMQHFTDYTRAAIDEHNLVLAKRCFKLADKLYEQGDSIVKNAIENIFVYSFSSFFSHKNIEKMILKSFISPTLYSLYAKQVGHAGC